MDPRYRMLHNGYGAFEVYRPDDTSICVSTKIEVLEQEIGYWISFDQSSLLWKIHDDNGSKYASLVKAVDSVTDRLHRRAQRIIEKARESEKDRRVRELNEYLDRLPVKEA